MTHFFMRIFSVSEATYPDATAPENLLFKPSMRRRVMSSSRQPLSSRRMASCLHRRHGLIVLTLIVFFLHASTAYKRPASRHIRRPSLLSVQRQRIVVRCKLMVDDDEGVLRRIPPLTVAAFGEDGLASNQTVAANGDPPQPATPVFARFVAWLLRRFVAAKTQYVSGLEINVLTPSNTKLIRGKIDALELKFDKMIFAQLFVSGGGRIILKVRVSAHANHPPATTTRIPTSLYLSLPRQDVDLRMRRFLFQNLQSVRKPYTIYGDFLLTQVHPSPGLPRDGPRPSQPGPPTLLPAIPGRRREFQAHPQPDAVAGQHDTGTSRGLLRRLLVTATTEHHKRRHRCGCGCGCGYGCRAGGGEGGGEEGVHPGPEALRVRRSQCLRAGMAYGLNGILLFIPPGLAWPDLAWQHFVLSFTCTTHLW